MTLGLVVALAVATICVAGEPDENRDALESRPMTPNQSASIDQPNPADAGGGLNAGGDDALVFRPPVESPEAPIGGVAQGVEVAGETQPSTRVRRPRDGLADRDTATSASRRVELSESVAWYRSGLGALGIVLAVIALVVWALRRWVPTMRGGGDAGALRVVGRVSLSPKHSVALVSLGHRYVLVGLAGDRVTPICEVTDPQEVADLSIRVSASGEPSGRRFEQELRDEERHYVASRTDFAEPEAAPSPKTARVSATQPLHSILRRMRSFQKK